MKLSELKVELAKRILESQDEEQLQTVGQLLNPSDQFKLSAAQKAELNRDFKDYKAGKGASCTWAEVKSHVRGLRGK